MTFRELRKKSGMTQQAFSDYFEIPKRTIESWDSGIECKNYLIDLMLYKLVCEGIINEDDNNKE